jgi:hypothetical protein
LSSVRPQGFKRPTPGANGLSRLGSARGNWSASAPGEEIERAFDRRFGGITERSQNIIRCLAACFNLARQSRVIITNMIGIFGAESDHAQAIVALWSIESDLADRLAVSIRAYQCGIGMEVWRKGIGAIDSVCGVK